MNRPKPLTPISIEKVDLSKLDRATFYVGLGKNGHLDSFSLSFLMSNQDWVTHLYLEQSEESKWISVEDRLPDFNKNVLVMKYPESPTMDGKLQYSIDRRLEVHSDIPSRLKDKLSENHNFTQKVKFWTPLLPPPTNQ